MLVLLIRKLKSLQRPSLTHRLELCNITSTITDTRIGQRLDFTVPNGQTGEDERVLNDEFENVSQGEEGEVGVFGREVFVKELPDRADCYMLAVRPISCACTCTLLRP